MPFDRESEQAEVERAPGTRLSAIRPKRFSRGDGSFACEAKATTEHHGRNPEASRNTRSAQ
jgi:hypothetical protein